MHWPILFVWPSIEYVYCVPILSTPPTPPRVRTEYLMRAVSDLIDEREQKIRCAAAAAMELQDTGLILGHRRERRICRNEHRTRPPLVGARHGAGIRRRHLDLRALP